MPQPRVQVPDRRRVGGAAQVAGIIVLAAGLGVLTPWLGLVALGAGLLALGVAMEVR